MQNISRLWTRHVKPADRFGTAFKDDTFRQRNSIKEPFVIPFRHTRPQDPIFVFGKQSHCEISGQSPTHGDQRRQTRSPDFSWHFIRKNSIKPVTGFFPTDHIFGKVRNIDDPCPVAQHFTFLTNRSPPVLAGKSVGIHNAGSIGKPERVFPAIVQAHHGAHLFLQLINRTGANGATGCALFVGEMNAEPMGILIANARLCELFAGPSAKTRHVPCKHIVFCFPFDDPLSRQKTHTARLAKARNNSVTAEIIFQLRRWTKQNIAIRRPDHWAVNHPLYTRFTYGGNAVNGTHHIFFDPFEIIIKQLMSKARGCLILSPETHIAFIGPHQKPLTFLAQVIFAIAISHRG